MENNFIIRALGLTVILGAILLTAFILVWNTQRVQGNGFIGVTVNVASSSSQVIPARAARVLFATSTPCTTRIITSRATPLMLTFSNYNNASPTGTFGHYQAASTTVAYEAGVYGCGLVKVYADVADTITATESQ